MASWAAWNFHRSVNTNLRYRRLGRTGIDVSALAFGAGPISGWMNLADEGARSAVVERAVSHGINWFDTAAGYGHGRSEACLGEAFEQMNIETSRSIHVATKVRLTDAQLHEPEGAVRSSMAASLERLRRPQVTLLQLHNAITERRGEIAFSVTPDDVLRPGGIADAMEAVRADGQTLWLGLTGIGAPSALRRVIASGRFVTMQTPFHLLNPTPGYDIPSNPVLDAQYDNIFQDCSQQQMGLFAIRVFAGGALLSRSPSPHTLTTPFFPLALYERDLRSAQKLRDACADVALPLPELAIRFVLSSQPLSAAIVGMGSDTEVDECVAWSEREALSSELVARVCQFCAALRDDEECRGQTS